MVSVSWRGELGPVAHRVKASRPVLLRLLLLAGVVLAVTAAWAVSPAQPNAADPELAFLLRGMAVIKMALIAPAVGLLWWRLGFTISAPLAGGYLAGSWMMAGATAMIWQLSGIALAAALFHLAGFAVLLLALTDRGLQRRSQGR